ncbi:acid protease [Trametes sanguinea]|nr:acid protease [Trametes sanguinea]
MFIYGAISLLSYASVLVSARTTPLQKRDAASTSRPVSPYPVAVSRTNEDGGFNFTNGEGVLYSATIYVNGAPYQVQLDTGSSDTWIDPLSLGVTLPPDLISTGLNSSTSYVDGSTSTGPVVLANVTFGPYTVYNQAITIAYNASQSVTMNGLIGLAGYSQTNDSSIYTLLKNTSYAENGVPIIYNIFEHGPQLPNYMTFLTERGSQGFTDGGVLTISEVLTNMTDILDAPRFNAVLPDYWDTFMDGLYVNGKFINGGSIFTNQTILDRIKAVPELEKAVENLHLPEGATVANFDSGTTRVRGPAKYAHAIYKDVPGAVLIPDPTGVVQYLVPCDTKINLTWSFNGVLYPMHPVDVLSFIFDDSDGTFGCLGSISGGPNGFEDWLLGDSFLHNVYILYGYGDPNGDLVAKQPYMQLLSRTDPDKAWLEFDAMMLQAIIQAEDTYTSANGTTSTPQALAFTGVRPSATLTEILTTPTGNAQATVTSSYTGIATATSAVGPNADLAVAGAASESDSDSSNKVDLSGLTRNSYIILGLLAAVLVMLLVTVVLMVKANRANVGYRAVPATNLARGKQFGGEGESYYATSYAEGGQ